MKSEKMLSAMGKISNDLIEDASIVANHKRHTAKWYRWGAMVACLCVVIVGIFVFAVTNQFSELNNNPQENGEHLLESQDKEITVVQSPSTPDTETIIEIALSNVTFNEFDSQLAAAPPYYDPELYDSVSWSEEEIYEYFGEGILPQFIPEGLLRNIGQRVVVSKTGEVCADTVVLYYYHDYDESGTPKHTKDIAANYGFSVTVSKLGLLNDCLYVQPENQIEQTIIGETAVTFGYREMPSESSNNEKNTCYDLYVAEFEMGDIAYQIVAEQLSAEDVIKIVSSIIYGAAMIEVE